jgi:phosphomannomutase
VSAIRFGTDGWRAIIADEFTYANVRRVAQAVADGLLAGGAPPTLVVGYDTRFASAQFAHAAAGVLTANGIAVILADRPTPTPAISFAVAQRGAAGGLIVTASHNPAIFNGIKLKSPAGSAASAEEVAAVEAAIARRAEAPLPVVPEPIAPAEAAGRLERVDLTPAYHARLAELVDLETIRAAGLTIVADAMYGAGGGHYPALLAGGSTRVVELNGQPNPAFPGLRGPEPVAANLTTLSRVVVESGSSLGLALDGDADRIALVDERGTYVNQQQVFALLTLYLIEQRGWRGPIVKSVNASTMLDAIAAREGLAVHTCPVGFKYLGPALMEHDGLIAGEESGGFAFHGHIPERDGILAGLFLIDFMRRLEVPASGLVAYLQQKVGTLAYERLDLTFAPDQREAIVARANDARPVRLADRAVAEISHLDGVKFVLEDGSWLLFRLSGTEPLLRLYAEAPTAEAVTRLLQQGRALLGLDG